MVLYFVASFLIAAAIGPLVIEKVKLLGIRQTERGVGAVTHLEKQGTPLMGGFIFLFPVVFLSLIFILVDKSESHFVVYFLLLSMLAFSLVGFFDDYIKAKALRNLGLTEKQTLFLQFLIAFVMAGVFFLKRGSSLLIPFMNKEVSFGLFYIPFMMFVIVGTVNSVNLLDGMDGLAAIVTVLYFLFYLFLGNSWNSPQTAFFALITIGGELGFLIYNKHPAKIFMGDTGAMALGGIVAGLSVVTETALHIPVVGFIFLLEALSVMIQVGWYKKTKKRIFLMAPIHYHFEKLGLKETSVVALFGAVQLILSIIGIFGL